MKYSALDVLLSFARPAELRLLRWCEIDWVERQLAHKDPNTTRAAYNHAKYLEQRADMVQKWADYLDELKAHSGI